MNKLSSSMLGRCAAACVVLLAGAAGAAADSHVPPPVAPPVVAPPAAPPAPPAPEGAVLQGLDKVTARISTFSVPVGREVRFGALVIRVRACHKTPPTEPPESTAFLEVLDVREGRPAQTVFSGWMFASSPALSAMEHPVYDVWVIDCMNSANSSSDNSG